MLGPSDHIGELIESLFQIRVSPQLEQVCRTFHDFVQVGINKAMGAMILNFLAGQKVTRCLEMLDTRLCTFKSKRYKCLPLGLQSRPPEVTGHLNLIEGHRLQRIVHRVGITGEDKYQE